jgi:hypothetical protein
MFDKKAFEYRTLNAILATKETMALRLLPLPEATP